MWTQKRIAASGLALAILFASIAAAPASDSKASGCPHNGVLGTARILTVDPAAFPRVGLKSFPQSLPLGDHEVVLTFDDGPSPPNTRKVLAALEKECVRATFFLIGKPASEYPELVRRIAAGEHTVGHHTWSHPSLKHIKPSATTEEIDHGIAADELALHGAAATTPSTPFFRFPNFESSPALLDLLQSREIAVFGADFWVSDWIRMTPEQEFKLLVGRLKAARKGIILMHDTKAWTAAMLPAFLRYLRDNGYHVVHLVPVTPDSGAKQL